MRHVPRTWAITVCSNKCQALTWLFTITMWFIEALFGEQYSVSTLNWFAALFIVCDWECHLVNISSHWSVSRRLTPSLCLCLMSRKPKSAVCVILAANNVYIWEYSLRCSLAHNRPFNRRWALSVSIHLCAFVCATITQTCLHGTALHQMNYQYR